MKLRFLLLRALARASLASKRVLQSKARGRPQHPAVIAERTAALHAQLQPLDLFGVERGVHPFNPIRRDRLGPVAEQRPLCLVRLLSGGFAAAAAAAAHPQTAPAPRFGAAYLAGGQ